MITKKNQAVLRSIALSKLIEKVGTRIGGTRKEGLEFLVEGLQMLGNSHRHHVKSSAAIKTIEPSSTTSLMNSQSQLRVGLPEMKKSKVATIDATTGATKMAALDKAKLIKLAAMMAKQSAAAAGTSVSVPGAPAKGATASVSTPKAPAAPTTVAQSTTNTMAPDPNTAVV